MTRPDEPFPELVETESGIVVVVHAQPGARARRVVGRHGDACKIAVTAPPVGGRANVEIGLVLAELFGVPAREITIVAGHSARRKRVAVRGLDAAAARARLAAAYRD